MTSRSDDKKKSTAKIREKHSPGRGTAFENAKDGNKLEVWMTQNKAGGVQQSTLESASGQGQREGEVVVYLPSHVQHL